MNPMDEIVRTAMGAVAAPAGGPGAAAGMMPMAAPGGHGFQPAGGGNMAGARWSGADEVDQLEREAAVDEREEQDDSWQGDGWEEDGPQEDDGLDQDEPEHDFQEELDAAAEELGFHIPDEVDDEDFGHQVAWIAQQAADRAVRDAVEQTVGPMQQQLAAAEARNQALANATRASSVIAQHAGVPDAAPQLQQIFSEAAMIGIDPIQAMQTPWFAALVMGYVNGHRVQTVAEGLRREAEPLPVAAHVGGGIPAESERPEFAHWDRALSRQFKDVLGVDMLRATRNGK